MCISDKQQLVLIHSKPKTMWAQGHWLHALYWNKVHGYWYLDCINYYPKSNTGYNKTPKRVVYFMHEI